MYSVRIPVTLERLKDKFFSSFVVSEAGCWEWKNVIRSNGYGVLQVGSHDGPSHHNESAHRFSYRIHYGEIPAGLFVLHRCDNKRCVNPEHLFVGTHDDNMKDKKAKRRQRVGSQMVGAKLKESDIERIFALRAEGKTFKEIAACFNVSRPTIQRVYRGRSWKHVERGAPH